MATRWAMTSTASATVLWVLAQRAIWFRLLPMRATCRVRSRSTAAAGAVHVRVHTMACRSSADSDTPAAAAYQLASSAGDTRAVTMPVRRSAVSAPAGGFGGGPPANSTGARASGGSKGGRSAPSPERNVQHCVGWLKHLSLRLRCRDGGLQAMACDLHRRGTSPNRPSGRACARTGPSGRRPLPPCYEPHGPTRPRRLHAVRWNTRRTSP